MYRIVVRAVLSVKHSRLFSAPPLVSVKKGNVRSSLPRREATQSPSVVGAAT